MKRDIEKVLLKASESFQEKRLRHGGLMPLKKYILKPILLLIAITFMTGCAIRDDSSYRKLIPAAEGFAHTFIDTRFDMYVNELGLSDFFITETVYGSNGFEKAYRFISADGAERTWGCRISLQSFKTTGARNNKMLDFVVLEEGEKYGAALMEKTFSKALETAPGVNVSKEETVAVTFPAGWNWVRAGEYFRDHKDETSLESEAMREYVENSVKRTFTNETIDSISVQDDLSVSLMLNKNLQKTRLENSVAGLDQSVREYENHHGDGVQRIEYSEDYRKCRVYVEREYIDKKLNKNLNHSYSRMDLAILLYRIQVWQGVSPEDLFADISVIDPDTDELISRETVSGGIWLQE